MNEQSFEEKIKSLDKETLEKIVIKTMELIEESAPDPSEYDRYIDKWSKE